jgi:6-phosphogluconolactonase
MSHPRLQVASPDALAETFASEFALAADQAIARSGHAAIAIPGGSAAERFLPRLAMVRRAWNLIHVFWCDERAVPSTDPASNAGLAARIMGKTPAASALIHPMVADQSNLGAAAERYAALLAEVVPDGRLDFVLLGVGEDGHIASLFPGQAAATDTRKTVLPNFNAPKPPSRRMTLAFPVLAAARVVVVAAFGAGKASAIRDAVSGTGTTPVAQILAKAERAILLLDPAAASKLDGHGSSSDGGRRSP